MRIMVAVQQPETGWSDAIAFQLKKCGYEAVTQAWTAEDVLTACREEQMDILILSDVLDGQSSVSLCEKIRQIQQSRDASMRILLFLSTKEEPAMERYVQEAMFSYIMVPPYNLEQLGQRIEQFETKDAPFLLWADSVIEETLLKHKLDSSLLGYDYIVDLLRIELDVPGSLMVLKDPLNIVAEKYKVTVPRVNQAVFRALNDSWQALGDEARKAYRLRPVEQGYPGAKYLLLSLAKSCRRQLKYKDGQ